jgi:hypothetical protein
VLAACDGSGGSSNNIGGGGEALDALYNSAEAYLKMWEQTVCRGADKPAACAN